MAWEVILIDAVDDWFIALDPKDATEVAAAIEELEQGGPSMGRPRVDRIAGSKYQNMKELRVSTFRLLFIFDPQRQAIILTAGDKAGQWSKWYEVNIPLAEQRYETWLAGDSVER